MEIAGFALYWAKNLLGLNYFLYKYEWMPLSPWPFRLTWLKCLGFLIILAMNFFFLWWKRQHVYFSAWSIFSLYWLSGSLFGHWWSMRRFDSHWEEVSWVLGRFSHTVITDLEVGISPPHCPCGWEFFLTDFCSMALGRDVISQQRAVLRTAHSDTFYTYPPPPQISCIACDVGSLDFKVLLCWFLILRVKVGMWPALIAALSLLLCL